MRKLVAISILIATLLAALAALRVFGSSDGPDSLGLRAHAQLEVLGAKVELYRKDTGTVPKDLHELIVPSKDGPYARSAELLDPWGAPFYYRPLGDSNSFVLFTLGSDGRLGGRQTASNLAYGGSADGS